MRLFVSLVEVVVVVVVVSVTVNWSCCCDVARSLCLVHLVLLAVVVVVVQVGLLFVGRSAGGSSWPLPLRLAAWLSRASFLIVNPLTASRQVAP